MNLTDAEIEEAMAAGQLVRNGEAAQLGPACYELRMGEDLLRSYGGGSAV